ncbi:hypothetical protein DNTS_006452 [Danionella cerebrum]|uniref:Uncharacterized protein n=1 Tax=Danionella cerebrum TaxID=2873325 RepID=A0A553N3Y3_9TELE|nr:hypothetical protein DNTS_006452 [Danionella translucida]
MAGLLRSLPCRSQHLHRESTGHRPDQRLLAVPATKVTVAVPTTVASHLITVAPSISSCVASTPIATAVTAVSTSIASAIATSIASSAATEAILVTAHASSSASSPASPRATARLNLLFREGFLHLHFVSVYHVEFEDHGFIGGVVVFEMNKAEAALLAGVFVRDDFRLLDHAKLGEKLGETADEYLLDLCKSFRSSGVFPSDCSLHLHVFPVEHVRPSRHCCVSLLRGGVRYKAETTGPLKVVVLNYHAVR